LIFGVSENLIFGVWGNFENMSEKDILDPWIKLASLLASTSGAMGINRFGLHNNLIYQAGRPGPDKCFYML